MARRSAMPRSPPTRDNIGWPHAPFEVPDDILAAWREVAERGTVARRAWEQRLAASPQRDAFETAIAGRTAGGGLRRA